MKKEELEVVNSEILDEKIDDKIDDLYSLRSEDNTRIEKYIICFNLGIIVISSMLMNNNLFLNNIKPLKNILISSFIPILCVIFSCIIGYFYNNKLIKESDKLKNKTHEYNKMEINALIYKSTVERENIMTNINMSCILIFIIQIFFMSYEMIKILF